jgi:hypothetical protein
MDKQIAPSRIDIFDFMVKTGDLRSDKTSETTWEKSMLHVVLIVRLGETANNIDERSEEDDERKCGGDLAHNRIIWMTRCAELICIVL